MVTVRPSFADTALDAATSRVHLRAWPSLSQAAPMLDLSLSALSRAMDARQIPKHPLGRARKIAPVALLNLAREYGADASQVAADTLTLAERSGVPQSIVDDIERDVDLWFRDWALNAPPPPYTLAEIVEAGRAALGDEAVQRVLAMNGRD